MQEKLRWLGRWVAVGWVLLLVVACAEVTPPEPKDGSPTADNPSSAEETPTPRNTLTPLPTATAATAAPDWQATVDGMQALTQELEIPEHLRVPNAERTGEEFDVNAYFTVLTHLSMESGYLLDYVYHYNGVSGASFIYARPAEAEGYATFTHYMDATGDVLAAGYDHAWLDHIEVDGSAEGFFELVVLTLQGEQFYLWWHAGYNDTTVVSSQEGVERVIEKINDTVIGCSFSASQEEQARAINTEPEVMFEPDAVRVRVVTFTKWGGFEAHNFTVRREFPHRVLDHETEVLVPFDWGVMF